jgi:hypothetical protein
MLCRTQFALAMEPQYRAIVKEFCALVGLGDAVRASDGGSFEVDGVTFSLSYRGGLDRESFFLLADVGTVESAGESLLLDLLDRNVNEALARRACFAVSSLTGTVLHIQRFQLGQATPQSLVEQMHVTLAGIGQIRRATFAQE